MTLDAPDVSRRRAAWSRGWWTAAVIALIAALVVIGRLLPVADGLAGLERWIRGLGAWGPVAFVLVFVGLAMLSLPIWPLGLAAGSLFGFAQGAVLVAVASNAASALGFLAGRHLAYDRIHAYARRHPRFADLDRAVAEHEWKVVALMRLSHGFPFGLSNYLCGALSLRFWPFWLASAAAMLPGMLAAAYAGAVGRDSLGRGPGAWLPALIGAAAMLALIAYLAAVVRKKLRHSVEKRDPCVKP